MICSENRSYRSYRSSVLGVSEPTMDPKNHVFPFVHTQYLAMITISLVTGPSGNYSTPIVVRLLGGQCRKGTILQVGSLFQQSLLMVPSVLEVPCIPTTRLLSELVPVPYTGTVANSPHSRQMICMICMIYSHFMIYFVDLSGQMHSRYCMI